ncbi:hypothetical protein E4U38_002041 [Claviceps purpurea]|nr:hypothetical protein E4U38_002041 [Claviceps purpurea]
MSLSEHGATGRTAETNIDVSSQGQDVGFAVSMTLQLLMRWGCKEKVKFRDFVDSEIVRPPVPTTGHELFIIEIVHHIRLARATPYKTLDPE